MLDNSGDHFRAAVGSGDVDGAAHVLVYTPGITTTVAGGHAGDDGNGLNAKQGWFDDEEDETSAKEKSYQPWEE